MADPEIPAWLKTLPLAPVYRPTETEFSDPIAFISRVEREAAAFGICKVIPPLPKPSKRFVLSNLNRSLAKSPELAPGATPAPATDAGVFTTRHQELGSRRARPPVHKQVWQSGEVYTIEQFEAKSKAFSRAHLGGFKEVSPLLVEALFWKAAVEKPIYVEYANDVPGSGFSAPDENLRYYSHRWKVKRRFDRGRMGAPKCPCPATSANDTQQKASGPGAEREATAGWRLSNSSWNLQVIARSPGSLTRFMPDEVPGVTSPMVYIGMLFSWFAWHVEDHELHSLNFLHTGSPKTWYAVPGGYASAVEEIVRVQGYGGNIDRLAALTMLGEKTTLLSPEVFMASGVPCCRLVQNPGEFVVTFPRAYHVGFSHGFNCGEAANFATPQWLKVAKDAAVRRAAMNYLPMLSHQQLLYMLAMSFISRIPRSLLPGVRSSRLKDRKKEEREILVKKAFLNDLMNENYLLCALLAKESTSYAVLWEPELLPSSYTGSQSLSSSSSLEAFGSVVKDGHGRETIRSKLKGETLFDCKTDNFCVENALHEVAANLSSVRCDNLSSIETEKSAFHIGSMSLNMETLEDIDFNEDDLPFGLNVDPGSLACVSCGVLGYPFMAIVQPSERASKEFFPVNSEESHQESGDSGCLNLTSCLPSTVRKLNSDDLTEASIKFASQGNLDSSCMLYPALHNLLTEGPNARCPFNLSNIDFNESSSHIAATSEVTGGKVSRTLSGRRVESQSSTMPHFPGNKSTINARKNFMNEDGCGYFSRLFEHRMDQFKPLNEDDGFSPNKGTKIGYSNGLHPCDRLEKFKRTMGVKENALAENDPSITNLSGIRPIYKTDTLLGAPVEKSEKKINKMWNMSNRIIRPRIFCLQHALEIEELLQCKGGANVLIICHSDYVKIKAHAISIAEEIGSRFNCKDVPLENASPEDLDLLNVSIDDEEHEEHGEDWTSKLGLNLRYCVKLRKQASPNQQQLTLALGGLFSESLPVSVVSSLKWHSRKSRTPYKVIGIVQSKSASGANSEKSEALARDSNSGSGKGIQVYESRKSGQGGTTKKKNHDLSRKCVLSQELCTIKETETSNHISTSGHVNFLNKEVENNNTDRLLTIPILIAENFLLHQDGRAMEKLRVPHDIDLVKSANPSVQICKRHIEIPPKELNNIIPVCDPVESQCDEVWMFEGSEMHQGIHTDEEPSKKRKAGGGSKKPESQAHSMATEVERWKVPQEIRVVAESGSAHQFDKSVGSLASESSARTSVDYSEDLHEVPVAWAPNLQASFCTSMFADDQPITALVSSSNNFEMPLEICATEEPKISIVDNSEVDLLVAWENNVQLESQSNNLNSSEMQQELHGASEMEGSGKGNDGPEMPQELRGASEIEDCDGKVSDCVKSSGHPVVGQMVEYSEKHSRTWFSEEVGPNPKVDDSAKPALPSLHVAVAESSAVHEAVENPMDANAAGVDDCSSTKDNLKPTIVYKLYVRRNKRKREAEAAVDGRQSCSSFIRSPCEGLRPRTGRAADGRVQTKTATVKATKKADGSVGRRGKAKGSCKCDVEGCRLNFRNREELLLHKRRNHRAYKGGRKRLSSHQSAAHHDDERPLKCPWKGCSMSFKWAWARTEHVRLHTGERPYKCKVTGCELTFRFISDFSRHRRKTGHSGGS